MKAQIRDLSTITTKYLRSRMRIRAVLNCHNMYAFKYSTEAFHEGVIMTQQHNINARFYFSTQQHTYTTAPADTKNVLRHFILCTYSTFTQRSNDEDNATPL